jgi:hypothetical protein
MFRVCLIGIASFAVIGNTGSTAEPVRFSKRVLLTSARPSNCTNAESVWIVQAA